MRGSLRVASGLAVASFVALTALPSQAQRVTAERELLGVRIWRTYSDVLKKHGRPTRIEPGAITAPLLGAQAGGAAGMATMGSMGAASSMGGGGAMTMPGFSGSSTSLPGMPGMGMMGSPGMMGGKTMPSMSSGGMMGSYGMMGGGAAAMGSPTMPGMGPMASAGMMGGGASARTMGMRATMPGMYGGMTAPSGAMMGSMGAPGMTGSMFGASGAVATREAESTEGEVTWVYEHGGNTLMFLFNKDGRVIQIQTFGYTGAGVTRRGIKLGANVDSIYKKYGWTANIQKSGDSMTLDYSRKAHVAFQLVNRSKGKGYRVVGITVALTDKGL